MPTLEGRDYELSVLSYLRQHPEFFRNYGHRLHELHFDYGPAKSIFQQWARMFDRSQALPTHVEMVKLIEYIAVQQEWASVVLGAVLRDVDEAYHLPVTEVTGDFLIHFLVRKESRLVAQDLIDKDPEGLLKSLPEIRERLEKLSLIGGRSVDDIGILPFSEEVLSQDLYALIADLYGGPKVPSGWSRLDSRLLKGFLPGELAMIMAATGVGKTLLLLCIALNMMLEGYRVVYYSTDNLAPEMMQRMYANVTKVPIGTEEDHEGMNKKVRIGIGGPSDLFVLRDLPPNRWTPRDLQKHLHRVRDVMTIRDKKRGVPDAECGKIHAVLVDYADHFLPEFRDSQRWINMAGVYTDLVAVGKEELVPVITASQGNRDALSAPTVRLKHLADAVHKAFPCAHIFAACQTEAEYHLGTMRFVNLKARRPEAHYVLPMRVDKYTQSVYENYEIEPYGLEGKGLLPGSAQGNAESDRRKALAENRLTGDDTPGAYKPQKNGNGKKKKPAQETMPLPRNAPTEDTLG